MVVMAGGVVVEVAVIVAIGFCGGYFFIILMSYLYYFK